jgi:hypothetical protein
MLIQDWLKKLRNLGLVFPRAEYSPNDIDEGSSRIEDSMRDVHIEIKAVLRGRVSGSSFKSQGV